MSRLRTQISPGSEPLSVHISGQHAELARAEREYHLAVALGLRAQTLRMLGFITRAERAEKQARYVQARANALRAIATG